MWLTVVGLCPPFPQLGGCVSHQSVCCCIYSRQKKQSTEAKEKVGYPHQHTTHTYLKHDGSAGLPAPEESLPAYRPSSSGPMRHTGARFNKTETGFHSCSFSLAVRAC
jgi:hypothetical protein